MPLTRRRGITLVELLVALAVLGVVLGALGTALIRGFRVSRAQLAVADMQANVRAGGLILPLELQALGYDSSIVNNSIATDLVSVGPQAIRYRAMRGWTSTCGTPTLSELRIRKPVWGMREPAQTDRLTLFVENDPNSGVDDQWIVLNVVAIVNGTCGADPALVLTMNTPVYSPGVNLALSQIFVGGPVRWSEEMIMESYSDANGLAMLGARSVSAGESSLRPVLGPLTGTNGIRFRARRGDGTEVAAGNANLGAVRSIEIELSARTANAVSLGGGTTRTSRTMTTTTTVALRNPRNR